MKPFFFLFFFFFPVNFAITSKNPGSAGYFLHFGTTGAFIPHLRTLFGELSCFSEILSFTHITSSNQSAISRVSNFSNKFVLK